MLPTSQLSMVPQRMKRSWLSLQHDLMSVRNTSVIHSSTIALLLSMARSADYFIGDTPLSGTCHSEPSLSSRSSGSRDADNSDNSVVITEEQRNHREWKELMSLQRAVYGLTKLEQRLKRRFSTGGMGPPLKRPSTGNKSFSSQATCMSMSSKGE